MVVQRSKYDPDVETDCACIGNCVNEDVYKKSSCPRCSEVWCLKEEMAFPRLTAMVE